MTSDDEAVAELTPAPAHRPARRRTVVVAIATTAIAAVVVGGTLLTGGQGGVGATLVGVLLLGVLFNILNNEGDWIGSYWQGVLRGIFLLAVVIIQNRLSARK